ncbi:MAG: FG-GAP repeat protein [Saprospiraceae bacterium]|nr:FG-GAP repeat protein [Saprospiraceae bacterium]
MRSAWAYGDDIGSNMNQGSAYIFVRSDNTWTQQAKLTVADGATDDNFGYSVSINGDYTILRGKP